MRTKRRKEYIASSFISLLLRKEVRCLIAAFNTSLHYDKIQESFEIDVDRPIVALKFLNL